MPDKARTDKERMDWLEIHVVNVRDELVYGSRDMFWATPAEIEGEESGPSDLRKKIDEFLGRA